VTSNASVARVTPTGGVEAVGPGRAVISAQVAGGPPSQMTVFVTGDLLVSSTRGGRFGVYALLSAQPESFYPVVADTLANNIDASYSPDRTRMVFASDRAGGNYDIYVADADGRNPARLTNAPGLDIQPVWTPDGQHVVFVAVRGAARQIHVVRAEGGAARQLTDLPGGAEEPTVSPDGRAVAFTGYPAGREAPSDIYVVPLGGGRPVQVTNTRDRRETRPVYLTSGELAWVMPRRDRREPDQLLRQSGAGGSPAAIVTSDLTMVDVAFAPDGSRVAWVASRPQERNRNVLEFTFQWRSLTSGAETSVRLLPGERITSPAY
jgi:Tol biopolymer transport system component